MSSIVLTCPLDGLLLGEVPLDAGNSPAEDLEPSGGHVHLCGTADVACVSGHKWHLSSEGGCLLERTG